MGMKAYVEDVLNAPMQLRQLWSEIRGNVNLPKEQVEAFDRILSSHLSAARVCMRSKRLHRRRRRGRGRSRLRDQTHLT